MLTLNQADHTFGFELLANIMSSTCLDRVNYKEGNTRIIRRCFSIQAHEKSWQYVTKYVIVGSEEES